MHLLHRDYSPNAMAAGRKERFYSGIPSAKVDRYVADDLKNRRPAQADIQAKRLAVAAARAAAAAVVPRRPRRLDGGADPARAVSRGRYRAVAAERRSAGAVGIQPPASGSRPAAGGRSRNAARGAVRPGSVRRPAHRAAVLRPGANSDAGLDPAVYGDLRHR